MKKSLVCFLLIVSMVLSPAVSFALSTDDFFTCFKLVSGIDYGEAVLKQAAGVLKVAFTEPICHGQLMSEDPLFYTMMGTAIALKLGTSINDKGKCQNLLNGIVDHAVGAKFLNENVANLTPDQQAQLKSAASDEIKKGISNIPGMKYWKCACEYAYSGLIVSEIKSIINKEKQSLKICGDVTGINSVISWAAKWTGLGCPSDMKINRDQFIEKVLKPDITKYALMNYEDRESQCMRSTSGQYLGCMYYYTGGPKACRMDNANPQCDDIMKTFRQMVLDSQTKIVKEAMDSCSKVGDGCIIDKAEPLLIDTYGKDATNNCISQGIKLLASSCKPKEQPCCQQVPLTPEIKCKKARAEAASRMGNLGSQIGQGFNNLQPTFATAQMIEDRQACQHAVMGNALKYLQDAACDAASKTPTDDISGIWPAALQAAKDMGFGKAYTDCDGPYNSQVKINGCKDKCSQPATQKALYGGTGAGVEKQCNSDCISGAIVGRTPGPGYEDSQIGQQSSCVVNCRNACRESSTSVECQNCQKPDWCGPGARSGTGSSSGSGAGSGGSDKTKPRLQ
jgi:hypothetical protein